jgi:hypothetical protein
MLKEAHTISYIQQASHEWIEGDEEEIAYAQATESLKVVPIDIQHGPKVLERFKVAHKPLVKALSIQAFGQSFVYTSLWSKLCLFFKAWRAMANPLSHYFVSQSPGHHLRKGLHY